ncbi:MAG: TonB-dependent receptor plug domain-containing protein, partial [Crocinitomicaceae bacterium]|nr:TonB-dependent receptor plug domain-containing protein [Crocinitomicaceae bacterium]
MRKQYLLTVFILLISLLGFAQNQVKVIVFDSLTNQSIMNAKISLEASDNEVYTDFKGNAILTGIPNGNHNILITFGGYKDIVLNVNFPLSDSSTKKILLSANELELDELVIEATRANKSVADLPTRTEVLTEEIDEAASMEPSKIAHLITHSTGIQVQTTAASSNGAVVRIQGLNGRYTQMLKDGFPLYGGFSGSLDVLQIPPLDLRQVEYIKGSASTLYGGGAIGGLINLLTKKVTTEETLLHINFSHIGAKDFNAFASRRFGKFGFTNLATFHQQTAYDPDNDGYADIPEVSKINFNPKLFFFPDDRTELYVGATISTELRTGGDMRLIDNQQADSNHFYLDKQNSSRYTTQISMKRSITSYSTITLKNSVSLYDRLIQINTNAIGEKTQFGGQQLNTFSELNYHLNKPKHNLNIGFNAYSDEFSEQQLDTNNLRNQACFTLGGYLNHLWNMHEKFVLESGLRTDWAQARTKFTQNDGEIFVLP